jgi:hypothetical protein
LEDEATVFIIFGFGVQLEIGLEVAAPWVSGSDILVILPPLGFCCSLKWFDLAVCTLESSENTTKEVLDKIRERKVNFFYQTQPRVEN